MTDVLVVSGVRLDGDEERIAMRKSSLLRDGVDLMSDLATGHPCQRHTRLKGAPIRPWSLWLRQMFLLFLSPSSSSRCHLVTSFKVDGDAMI